MAYVLGFFAADGYITVNKRGGQYWGIQIIDKNLLEEIKKVIGSEHAIGCKKGKENESTLYRLQIGSIEICDALRGLGFSEKKTNNMTLPGVPEEYVGDFIRGYFDGDGNVWVGKNNARRERSVDTILVMFTSCSESFLQSLKQRLILKGLKGGSLYSLKEGYFRLSLSVQDSLKLFEIMYNNSTSESLYLKRKKDVFEQFIAMRP